MICSIMRCGREAVITVSAQFGTVPVTVAYCLKHSKKFVKENVE